ncbi:MULTISPECIES: hypothetical protein [unclassified Peribacillus]|uniref:hypothetical protein n=1 Tax=unclassified Peribacillus TaxID=2675266 RepID=UPI0036716814
MSDIFSELMALFHKEYPLITVRFVEDVTILPQSDLEQIDVSEGKIKVIHLNPRINWQIGIAWKKDSYLSYTTRTWIDFIKT